MSRLYGNIINESEKLFLKKKTIFFFIITAIIPFLSAILLSKFQNSFGIAAISPLGFMVTMLDLFTTLFLPLFIVMAAADEFSGEISDRTLKLTLLRPISRFKVYTSKIMSIGIYIIATLLIILISSTLSGLFLGNGSMVFQNIKITIAAFFPAMGIALLSVFIAQIFKNASGAIITLIFVFIGLRILGFFIPIILRISLISYLNWHVLWLGNVGIGRLSNIFVIILSYYIIFFAAGFGIFDNKDI